MLGAALLLALLPTNPLERWGPVAPVTPVPWPVLAAVLVGLAVGVAVQRPTTLPGPRPPRLLAARAAWLLAWCGAGALLLLACGAGAAGLRTAAVHATLALGSVALGRGELLWVPSGVLLLASMLLGASADDAGVEHWAWWARTLDPVATPGDLALPVAALLLAAVPVVTRRSPPRRP